MTLVSERETKKNKNSIKNKDGVATPIDPQDTDGPDFSSIPPAERKDKKVLQQGPVNVDFSEL